MRIHHKQIRQYKIENMLPTYIYIKLSCSRYFEAYLISMLFCVRRNNLYYQKIITIPHHHTTTPYM